MQRLFLAGRSTRLRVLDGGACLVQHFSSITQILNYSITQLPQMLYGELTIVVDNSHTSRNGQNDKNKSCLWYDKYR